MSDEPTPLASRLDEAERVLWDEHEDVLRVVGQCADAVAAEWDGDAVDDRERVVPPFSRALDGSGALARLPRALADAVSATGRPMPAPPVAAPPYVVVTGEGVVLRANLGEERLVMLLRTFEVNADGENRYVRTGSVTVESEVV